ncbi:MAG TPA: hypothetical protein VJR70_11845 [Stellaceae bacterium]|nr:hypothetical protein [Stellaceae bacterium]
MSDRNLFIELCVSGKAAPQDIDDFIDRWHENPEETELQEFLGITPEEYGLWLGIPDTLPYIVKARREARPLTEVVAAAFREIRRATGASDQATAARLQKWLKTKGEPVR